MKGIQIGKEKIKLSLFTDNMILCAENPKDSTKKNLLEQINKSSKVAGYKVRLHFYTRTMSDTKRKFEKTIPYTKHQNE